MVYLSIFRSFGLVHVTPKPVVSSHQPTFHSQLKCGTSLRIDRTSGYWEFLEKLRQACATYSLRLEIFQEQKTDDNLKLLKNGKTFDILTREGVC